MTEKKTATQTFIIISGRHTRDEGGKKRSLYQPGDLIELTEAEALKIRDKIMTVAQFEAKVEAHQRSEVIEERAEELMKTPETPRDPASLERAKRIEEMQGPKRTMGL